jgi:hypothetical protein
MVAAYKLKKRIDDAKLVRLWVTRMKDRDIAEALGHHVSTLRRRAVKLGLPSCRRSLWKGEDRP